MNTHGVNIGYRKLWSLFLKKAGGICQNNHRNHQNLIIFYFLYSSSFDLCHSEIPKFAALSNDK